MSTRANLVVEVGVDKGVEIRVRAEGIRLGRSDKNDLVLHDPLLSRHHCRLFFKQGALWVTDLGSANQTIVNGQTVAETPLHRGDTVTLGDTVLKVLHDREADEEEGAATPPAPVVDLGLSSGRQPPPARNRSALLVLIGTLVTVLALVIWVPKLLTGGPSKRAGQAPAQPPDTTLEVQYEKIQATPDNIFRYRLDIAPDNRMSAVITDIKNSKQMVREPKTVDAEYARSLAASLRDSGFFGLAEEYVGVQPDVLESYDLTITIGRKTHRVRIVNRVEPEPFRRVREKLENSAEHELGLAAIPYTTETLIQMASDALLQGKKLYDEREVRYGNLAAAIQRFREAEWKLEAVEPKPAFYAEILAGIRDCETELQRKHQDQNFRAERAIKLREWKEAAAELRILLEMVPATGDPRHEDARKKLLDVESRLTPER